MTATGKEKAVREVIRDAPSLAAVVRVELAALCRGFPLWLFALFPLALMAPLGLISAFSPEGRSGDVWGVWFSVTLMFWGIALPMAAALAAAAAARTGLGPRRVLAAYAFPRRRLVAARLAALLALSLASALLLTVLLSAAGAVLAGPAAAVPVPAGVLVPWACGIASVALFQLLAEVWGTGAAAGAGVVGMVLAGTVSDTAAVWALPPAWPMRAVIPIAEIEASGVPLRPGDPLLSWAPLPAVAALSIGAAAVLIALYARHVDHKEL